MVKVCARYNGTSILLGEFETELEADEFMKHDYVLAYSDESEDLYEDELIYSDEMYIDHSEDIPFTDTFYWENSEEDLPF